MVTPPEGLASGGLALWSAACSAKSLHPGELVVLEEACRIKDRCDLFARLLDGDQGTWAQVREFQDRPGVAVLMVDGAVTEARLHAGELRQLIEKLRLPAVLAGPVVKGAEPDDAVAAARVKRASRRSTGAAGS
jgi:hypothetical protein